MSLSPEVTQLVLQMYETQRTLLLDHVPAAERAGGVEVTVIADRLELLNAVLNAPDAGEVEWSRIGKEIRARRDAAIRAAVLAEFGGS